MQTDKMNVLCSTNVHYDYDNGHIYTHTGTQCVCVCERPKVSYSFFFVYFCDGRVLTISIALGRYVVAGQYLILWLIVDLNYLLKLTGTICGLLT